MFKFSLEMVKTTVSTSVTISPVKSRFGSIFNRKPRITETDIQSNLPSSPSIDPELPITSSSDSQPASQLSFATPMDSKMAVFKRRILTLVQFVRQIFNKIPVILGIFGGCHALYHTYLSSTQQQTEKLELIVLRRST